MAKDMWYSDKYKNNNVGHFGEHEYKPETPEIAPTAEKLVHNLEKKEKRMQDIIKEEISGKKDRYAKETERARVFINEPKHIKLLKILLTLLPIILFCYLIYVNYIVSQTFNYFYDIGGKEDAKKPYLTPPERISDIYIDKDGVTYRNLTGHIIYFNIPIEKGSNKIKIEVKMKPKIPENYSMTFGARDQDVWHYTFNELEFYNEEGHYKFNQFNDKEKDSSGWSFVTAEFDIKNDNLYIKNDQLSLVFYNKFLFYKDYKDYQIPLDYINITVYKPGLIEKYKNGEPIFFWQKEENKTP